jgi:flagellar hook assembly protein FlgD
VINITKIAYQIPFTCRVSLTIYDATGRLVRTLVDRVEDAGYKSAIWNGKDDEGNDASSGIYFYKLKADDYIIQKKMILIR